MIVDCDIMYEDLNIIVSDIEAVQIRTCFSMQTCYQPVVVVENLFLFPLTHSSEYKHFINHITSKHEVSINQRRWKWLSEVFPSFLCGFYTPRILLCIDTLCVWMRCDSSLTRTRSGPLSSTPSPSSSMMSSSPSSSTALSRVSTAKTEIETIKRCRSEVSVLQLYCSSQHQQALLSLDPAKWSRLSTP